ncbi:MAG TPA: hypothetical protein VFY52_02290 [Thermoleophilaceae bacterium]|nr:hypothetical protein [Thermoleophilaceae bacterium]
MSLTPIASASIELERRRALTRRVQVGAYYGNGERLAEVVKVYELGYVLLRDVRVADGWSGDPSIGYSGFSIDAFRREWWLVKAPSDTEEAA